MKVYTISQNSDYTNDTLRNTGDPSLMMHGEKRIVEYDTSYIGKGNTLKLFIQGPDSIRNKIKVIEETAFRFTLHDTSQGDYLAQTNEYNATTLVRSFNKFFRATSLGFPEAYNGIVCGIGSSTVPAKINIDPTKVLSDARGNLGKVRIYWTPGLVIKTPGEGQLWPDKVNKGYIERTWSQYKSEVLSNDYLNIIPKNGAQGKVIISFVETNGNETSTYAQTQLAINDIGFVDNHPDYSKSMETKDKEDSDNYFLRENDDHKGLQNGTIKTVPTGRDWILNV